MLTAIFVFGSGTCPAREHIYSSLHRDSSMPMDRDRQTMTPRIIKSKSRTDSRISNQADESKIIISELTVMAIPYYPSHQPTNPGQQDRAATT